MHSELLEHYLPHIEAAMYPQRVSLLDWRMKEGIIPGAEKTSFSEKGWTDIRVPFEWGKFNRTVWFRTTMEVPDAFAGRSVGLRLRFPEAQVYVNGQPVQGIDANRSEVFLFDKVRRKQSITVAVEAYSGRSREKHVFEQAELVEINPTARLLHTWLVTLQDLASSLEAGSPEIPRIRELIRRTLIFVKYFAPDGEEYPNAIGRAVAFLQSAIEDEFRTTRPGSIHLIGQSHIDVVWLWRIAETARKCGRTFSTALRMTERFPEFTFAQSQMALYDLTKRTNASVLTSIKKAVETGRWEAVGRSWVEPDCNIPSGESLVRQILHGTSFATAELGASSDVYWLPDTFGYAWSLPQILKRSGFNAFFTTKLRWNDTTTFPHTSFVWEGIDGTRILAHIPPLGLEAQVTPRHLLKTAKAIEDREVAPPVMQTFGFGDGGGGVTPEHLEAASLFRSLPGVPPASLSSPSSFFKALAPHEKDLPVWNRELYLEKHRGTYTSQAWVKKANRSLEQMLYTAEVLSVFAENIPGVKRVAYPAAELDKAWKLVLLNQFHDIVPGTYIRDAGEDIRADYAAAQAACDTVIQRSVRAMTGPRQNRKNVEEWTVFNSLAFSRDAYVEVSVPFVSVAFQVSDDTGAAVEYQVLSKGKQGTRLLLYLASLPPMGARSVTVTGSAEPAELAVPWKINSRAIETPHLRVRFDNKGDLSSIYVRALKKEILHKGKRGNTFQTFADKPKEWEAWDLSADYERNKLELFTLKQSSVTEEGPLRVTITQEYRSANGSVIRQDIRLYHRTARIDFDTRVRWKERQTFMKVAFPLAPRTNAATYEIQFGAIERPNRSRIPEDKAKFEVPAQQWAALGDGKFGAAVLNDAKYGYDCRDHMLRLSLLRSAHYPHPTDPWHATDTSVMDQGDHEFRYALYPYAGTWKQGGVVAEARAFNVPPVIFSGAPRKPLTGLVSVNKPNVGLTAFKKAESGPGYILRVYEAAGQQADATLTFFKNPTAAAECDLIENDLKPVTARGGKLHVRLKPFEIRSYRILFKGKNPARSRRA